MVHGSEIPPPDLILANSAWLHRFTRKLVHDADLAEDVGQEALLAGLSKPDSSRTGPSRPWLAGVARNIAIALARKSKRRQQAEQAASRAGTAPETADVAAELELQSAAVRALLTLHEPYQTALVWRFMKGLSYREMAKRSKVPVETVRARIKRGLALLRAKLDQEHGGRRGWLVPIGIPSVWRQSTPALWGIVLMKMKTKVLLSASLLVAGLLGIWYVTSPPTSPPGVPQREAGGIMVADTSEPARTAVAGERVAFEPEPMPPAEVETASLLVRVTWQDTGKPAAHVGLHVGEEDWTSLGHLASTGEDGTARFEGLEPGRFTVNMDRLNDHLIADVELEAGKEATLDLEVHRGVDVRGIVVDPQGLPLPDAEILVLWPPSPQWLFPTARSDGQGRFFLRSLGALNKIGARAEGRAHSDFRSVDGAERVAPGEVFVRLVLPGSPSGVIGTVYGPEGTPVPGAWVEVGDRTPQVIRHTDARGNFEVGSLQPGVKPVRVYGEGFVAWEGEVECLPSATTSMSIQLQRGASLVGRVTDGEDRPLEGVGIQVYGLRYPQRASARTDSEGRYRIQDLPGGGLSVAAYNDELGIVRNTLQFTLGQEIRWDVSLEPGLVLRGVLVGSSGEPLEGWWVREGGIGPMAVTDSEGRFSLNGLEDRPYDLDLYQRQALFLPRIRTLEDVYPGGPERTWVVPDEAMPSAWIRGRVLDPEGRPVTDADLSLSLRQGDLHIRPTADPEASVPRRPLPDSEGGFEIGPLPPDNYTLRAGYPDRLTADFGEITLLPNEVYQLPDGRLRHGSHLQLTVLGTEEQLDGLQVAVVDGEAREIQKGIPQGTGVGFRLLPPGTYRLSITGPNIDKQLLPIELKAQETLALQIDLR